MKIKNKREQAKSWSSFSKYILFHLKLFEIQGYRRFTQLKKSFDEKKDHWADMLYLSLVLSIGPGWKANEIRY